MFVGVTDRMDAVANEGERGSPKAIAFMFNDEEVIFEDPRRTEFLGDMTVTKFGCV